MRARLAQKIVNCRQRYWEKRLFKFWAASDPIHYKYAKSGIDHRVLKAYKINRRMFKTIHSHVTKMMRRKKKLDR